MMRQTIDEYLDGVLDAQARASVEQTLVRDPMAAELARTMQSERAIRAAVYESYAPSKAEASALASQILAACEDEAAEPVGRITPQRNWVRYTSGVAAAIAVALTAFGLGRMTAPAGVPTVIKEKSVALYVKLDDGPAKLYDNLTSVEEVENIILAMQAPVDLGQQLADAGDVYLRY
jgi:anti-sigma-K factor RskA